MTVVSFSVREINAVRCRELSAEMKNCDDENLYDTTTEATLEETNERLEDVNDDKEESRGPVKRVVQKIYKLVEQQHEFKVDLKKRRKMKF